MNRFQQQTYYYDYIIDKASIFSMWDLTMKHTYDLVGTIF